MNENKKWHAIYTRQGRERKVSESLSRKKIETIKSFLSEYPTVKLEKVGMNMNNSVTVTSDLFLARDYLSHSKDEKPKVMLPSLGYVIVAAGEGADGEIIFRDLTEVEAQAG